MQLGVLAWAKAALAPAAPTSRPAPVVNVTQIATVDRALLGPRLGAGMPARLAEVLARSSVGLRTGAAAA